MSNNGTGVSPEDVKKLKSIAAEVVTFAIAGGADAAEVLCRTGMELTAKIRMGEAELVQEAGSRALGLRVFKDGRRAVTYTSDLNFRALKSFAAEGVTLAALSEPDELNALPAREELIHNIPDLDLYDENSVELDAETALSRAKAGEAAALAKDTRISNSEGATWSRVLGGVAFAN